MKLIRVNRKLIKILFCTILIGSLGLNIYNFHKIKILSENSEQKVYNSNQSYSNNLLSFLVSINYKAQDVRIVEIFDVEKGRVVKRISSNDIIQAEAAEYLNEITGIYVKVKAIPQNGFMVKIPLEPPVSVQNEYLSHSVSEVIIIFPKDQKPYLLVLDEKLRPLFYNFDTATDELTENLNFPQLSTIVYSIK